MMKIIISCHPNCINYIAAHFAVFSVWYNMNHLCVSLHAGAESAGHYFEQSLSAYENSAGPHDPAFLTAQDDYCRFLLFNGQQEVTHNVTNIEICSNSEAVSLYC